MAENDKKKYYWLKLDRNFFKRHDIRIVETMPNGKDYILFYLKLLCESTSHEGCLRFSDTIPYNDEMLATVTNTNIDVVRSAIKIFRELHMLDILDDGTIFMEEVAKLVGSETGYARRKREYRNNQKLLTGDNFGQCPLEKEIEKEKELDIEKEEKKDVPDTNVGNTRVLSKNTRAPSKHIHGEHKKVRLTDDELNKLKSEYSNSDELIQYLDEYKAMTGKTYKSDYLAIKKWVVNAVEEKRRKQQLYRKNQRVVPLPKYMTEQAEEKREASTEEKAETLKEMYKAQMLFEQYDRAEQSAKAYHELTGRDIKEEVGEIKPFEE